jgi:hypothetical protein
MLVNNQFTRLNPVFIAEWRGAISANGKTEKGWRSPMKKAPVFLYEAH